MTETGERLDDGPVCRNSGLSTATCICADCLPINIDFTEVFAECRDISVVGEKVAEVQQYLSMLDDMGFDVDVNVEESRFEVIPPHVCHSYWAPCEGCGHPILLDIGENQEDSYCATCCELAEAYYPAEPRYYHHLFQHIMDRCNLREENGRAVLECNHDLFFAREFCARHGFDFDTIKVRLNMTGGFCDCEVCLNSQFAIPRFHCLPRAAEDTGGQLEDE